jgi:hypothetical protein
MKKQRTIQLLPVMMMDIFLFMILILIITMKNHRVNPTSFSLFSRLIDLFYFFSAVLPRKTERIQQWLSSCETKEDVSVPKPISPNTQYKMRFIAKPNRHPSLSPQRYHEQTPPPSINIEVEPARFRSCLKIHLETNEPTNHRSRASSATSKPHQRQPTISNEDLDITEEEYFQQSTLSPVHFQRDHQAVFL